MDQRARDVPRPLAGRIPRPFVLRRRPLARSRLRCVPPVRRIRRCRICVASVSLRPLRRSPSPVRRGALPLRLRGGRSSRDRRSEIRGPPLPGRRGGPPPPRDPRGALEGPDPGRGSSDRGPGTGPPLEIFPAGVQPPSADRFPSFAPHRSPVRSAGAFENPRSGFPGAPSRDPPARKRREGFPCTARPQGPLGDPSARRRVHHRRHGGSVRPRLEKRRRGLYSGRDGRARRPLIPMRCTESRCPSRRSSPPRCSSAST
jgi:hypothetical protein